MNMLLDYDPQFCKQNLTMHVSTLHKTVILVKPGYIL